MKKYLFTGSFLVASVVLVAWTMQDFNLKRVKAGEQVKIHVPENFTRMSKSQIQQHFKVPEMIGAWIGPNGKTTITVDKSKIQWGKKLDVLRGFYKSTIHRNFYKVNFIQDTIVKRGKKDTPFLVYEYVAEVGKYTGKKMVSTGEKRYTYRQYVLAKDQRGDIRIFILSFNGTYGRKHIWQPMAREIMKKVQVKKTL